MTYVSLDSTMTIRFYALLIRVVSFVFNVVAVVGRHEVIMSKWLSMFTSLHRSVF